MFKQIKLGRHVMMLMLGAWLVAIPAIFCGNSGQILACVQDADTTTAADQATSSQDDSADSSTQTETAADSATETEEAVGATKAKVFSEAWIKEIDAWFGKYLVAPLGKVLFFSIYTYDAKDDAGNLVKEVNVPLIVIWLLVGATFFTIFFGFINIRGFWHAIRLTSGAYDNPDDTGEVSHFQALSSALSGTVGLGNIAGVAIAIAQGGPGATFWMILIGLLGMSSKFCECTLGQMYRQVDVTGRVSGGPMRYLKSGLSEMGLAPIGYILAFIFALLCIGGSLGGGNTFQISQSLDVIKTEVPIINQFPWIYGLVMCLFVGLVIVGGIKSIGKVAGRIVPFMCAGYVICAMVVLVTNWDHIGEAFSRIWNEAFNAKAAYGGFLGCLVIGIKRAVFSNEAGAGSASIAHSAAKTDIPVREGYVALLEPFIDTVVVCTMTALVIIITGVVDKPEEPVPMSTIAQELALLDVPQDKIDALERDQAEALLIGMNPDIDKLADGTLRMSDYIALDRGAYFTKEAFVKSGHAWFRWFLYVAVVLFAFSTCITWYYYGERCFTTLLGQWASPLYKIIFLTFTFLGSIVATTNIKDFSDMLILGMAFPNMLGMYFLCGKVRGQLSAYQDELKSGKFNK